MNKSAPTAMRRSKRILLQKEGFLTNIPQDIIRKILGRLPIRSIMRCKCVCKSWRSLIEGGDFALEYTPQPGLAFVHRETGYIVCDEGCKPLCRFDFRPPDNQDLSRTVVGSANGLILVRNGSVVSFCICNPITSEYIELPRPPMHRCVFGFGVSKLSGQYKILCSDRFGSL